MAMFAEVEKFLAPILGGRYQEDMPEDVAARLEELRVDINSVTYAGKEDATYSSELPAINGSLKAGSEKLALNIAVGDQTIDMTTEREISQDGENWVVSDASSGPMGEMSDKVVYNASYQPISRSMVQAGQAIEVTYSSEQVSIDMAGKVTDIAIEGVLIDMAPGFENVIALMDLTEEGVTGTGIDLNTMKGKTVVVKANGEEELDGVNCKKIQITDYLQ